MNLTRTRASALIVASIACLAQCRPANRQPPHSSGVARPADVTDACSRQTKWASRIERNESDGELYRALFAIKQVVRECSTLDRDFRLRALRIAVALGDWETVEEIASRNLASMPTPSSPERAKAEHVWIESRQMLAAPSEEIDVEGRLEEIDALVAAGQPTRAKQLRDSTIVALERQISRRLGVRASVMVDDYEPLSWATSVRWSAKDDALAIVDGPTLAIIDTASHLVRFRFQIPGASVTDICTPLTSQVVASCWSDGSARVWDVETGRLRWTAALGGCDRIVVDSSDHRLAVSGGNRLTVLDLDTGAKQAELVAIADVTALAWSPQRHVVFATAGGDLRDWEVGKGDSFIGRTDEDAINLAFRPMSNQLAVQSKQQTKLIEFPTLARLWGVETQRSYFGQTWNRDGSRLVLAGAEEARVFAPDGTLVGGMYPHVGLARTPMSGAALDSSSNWLAFVWHARTLVVEAMTGTPPQTWSIIGGRPRSLHELSCVTVSKDSVLAGGRTGIFVLPIDSGSVRRSEFDGSVTSIAGSLDGRVLAGESVGFMRSPIMFWEQGASRINLTLPGFRITHTFALSRNGSALLLADFDAIGLWETGSKSLRWRVPAPSTMVVALDEQARLAVTADWTSLVIRDAQTGVRTRAVSSPTCITRVLEVAPSAKWFVGAGSTCDDNRPSVRVWGIDGELLWSVPLKAFAVAVDPTERWIAIGGYQSVSIRDAKTGAEVTSFAMHAGPVKSIGWVNSEIGVSVSERDGVRFWSASDGQLRATVRFPIRARDEPVVWTVLGAGERRLVEIGGHKGDEPVGFQCRIGDRLFSWKLCYGVFREQGLFARSLHEAEPPEWP